MEVPARSIIIIPGLILPKGYCKPEKIEVSDSLLKFAEENKTRCIKSRNINKKETDDSSLLSSLEESFEKCRHRIDPGKTRVLNICTSLCTTSMYELKKQKSKMKHSKTYQSSCKYSRKLDPVKLNYEDNDLV